MWEPYLKQKKSKRISRNEKLQSKTEIYFRQVYLLLSSGTLNRYLDNSLLLIFIHLPHFLDNYIVLNEASFRFLITGSKK